MRQNQTARKSVGGKAPRYSLAGTVPKPFRPSQARKIQIPVEQHNGEASIDTQPSTGIKLPIIAEEGDPVAEVDGLELFDLTKPENWKYFGEGYTESRRTIVLEGSLHKEARGFLETCLARAKDIAVMQSGRYAIMQSRWMLVWQDDKGVVSHMSEDDWRRNNESWPAKPFLLTTLLERGALQGCEVRGNKETRQFALVAKVDLPAGTPVAMEGGVLWDEQAHDRMLKVKGDPMIGLVSNEIPLNLLKPFANKKQLDRYLKHVARGGAGFIVESSSHGNETKIIDDPGWTYADNGNDVPAPTLESHLVFDLERGLPTVVFITRVDVKKGEELNMDWGCWHQIANVLLPGQAKMSMSTQARLESIEEKAAAAQVQIPDHLPAGTRLPLTYFNPKSGAYDEWETPDEATIAKSSIGDHFDMLSRVGLTAAGQNETAGPKTKRSKKAGHEDAPTAVDFGKASVAIAVRSDDLSQDIKKALDAVPKHASTVDAAVRPLFRNEVDLSKLVKVVELTDKQNATVLFSLPKSVPYGVVAKKEIKQDDPVMCYGGDIQSFEEESTPVGPSESDDGFNAYIYDLSEMPSEYNGPRLYINGANGLGGKINDPWSPTGTPQRQANLEAIVHWDAETNTPQVVLYATRAIEKGEELLLQYGTAYWKVMWRHIMIEHATFAQNARTRYKWIENAIAQAASPSRIAQAASPSP